MVLLCRKRLMIILMCMVLSMFVYFVGMDRNKATVQTVGLPVSNKVVILDAGHRRRR